MPTYADVQIICVIQLHPILVCQQINAHTTEVTGVCMYGSDG